LSVARSCGQVRRIACGHAQRRSPVKGQAKVADRTVFAVSDDSALRDSVSELVASGGLCAETFPSLEALLAAVPPERRGCLVLDARVCKFIDPERLARFASLCATRSVLLLIERGDVPTAVRAIKCGALDVVEKPYSGENLLERIKRAIPAARVANR
jgi:two-component system response regulator FixJ